MKHWKLLISALFVMCVFSACHGSDKIPDKSMIAKGPSTVWQEETGDFNDTCQTDHTNWARKASGEKAAYGFSAVGIVQVSLSEPVNVQMALDDAAQKIREQIAKFSVAKAEELLKKAGARINNQAARKLTDTMTFKLVAATFQYADVSASRTGVYYSEPDVAKSNVAEGLMCVYLTKERFRKMVTLAVDRVDEIKTKQKTVNDLVDEAFSQMN